MVKNDYIVSFTLCKRENGENPPIKVFAMETVAKTADESRIACTAITERLFAVTEELADDGEDESEHENSVGYGHGIYCREESAVMELD